MNSQAAFRPAFVQINKLVDAGVQLVWLTATMSRRTWQIIGRRVTLGNFIECRESVERENLQAVNQLQIGGVGDIASGGVQQNHRVFFSRLAVNGKKNNPLCAYVCAYVCGGALSHSDGRPRPSDAVDTPLRGCGNNGEGTNPDHDRLA